MGCWGVAFVAWFTRLCGGDHVYCVVAVVVIQIGMYLVVCHSLLTTHKNA